MAKKFHLYPHKIERVLLLILGNPFTIIGWSMTKPTMIDCRLPPSRLLEQHGSITKFSFISFFTGCEGELFLFPLILPLPLPAAAKAAAAE